MKYPSAIDLWLGGLLIGGPVFVIGLGIHLLSSTLAGGWMTIAIGLFTGGLIAIMALPCHYTLEDQRLRIKCGMMDEEIPFSRIRAVEKSRNPLSAPALSLKRVKITLDEGFRLISPKDREGFIEALRLKIAQGREG